MLVFTFTMGCYWYLKIDFSDFVYVFSDHITNILFIVFALWCPLESALSQLHICSIWRRPNVVQVCTAICRIAGLLIHICGMCHTLIRVNIRPLWCVENTDFFGNDEYRAKLAQLRMSDLLHTTYHFPNAAHV